jgi:RES domain-containing protein
MNFKDLHPPILEIPDHQVWHRVQRKSSRKGSVRLKGYLLPPTGGMTGRFDLPDEPTVYLADSPETALYESIFRREVRSCHWDRLMARAMVTFETRASLRLADLRGLEERYPVLQSMRYEISQRFSAECRLQGLHGVLYSSAQHPQHSCVCLFHSGILLTKKLTAFALIEPGTNHLLKSVVNAAHGSQVPIVGD